MFLPRKFLPLLSFSLSRNPLRVDYAYRIFKFESMDVVVVV
ncbi:hypothetical protein SLEP1_g9804 [Rubroshorea leprosula]|uniref:Uncharacterized protein n=1 Tax=Rubroshorea leprosula TaxID=152421 RepID=A0AAV5IH17_9ROSI|nr:hypothetical protein SLEP1_g9804 [Rubroshorea leprosula]